MIVATARYFDTAPIVASGLVPLASTVGAPKFPLAYPLGGGVGPVAPHGVFGRDLTTAQFRRAYRKRLDGFGHERLAVLFQAFCDAYESAGVVLLCYCADPDVCHRRLFAEWWEAKTGESVAELGQLKLG